MRNAARFLMRPVSTKRFDDRLAQFSCYFSALMVLVLGILKLSGLGLDETRLFFGLLLVLCLTMLLIIAGTLAGPSEKVVWD
jgi:hypothetical protein